jgi:putative membrane protein
MAPAFQSFLQRWFTTTLGVFVAASVLSGVHAEGLLPLLAASLILGVLNAVLRPALVLVSLPLVLLTLGLFMLVINAVLLYFVSDLVKGFHVADFWSAFKGGIVISIVSMFANLYIGRKIVVRSHPVSRSTPAPPSSKGPDTGSGPIIDV